MKDERREIFFENLGSLGSLGKGRGRKFTKFTTTQFLVRSREMWCIAKERPSG